jgi:hypothetical protein
MGCRTKPALPALLLAVALLVSACGGSGATLSAARVRSIFAHQGLRPKIVFDSRTAGRAEINRIAPLTGSTFKRRASALTRKALRRLVAERKTHPVTWLVYSVAQVFIWRKLADAQSDFQRTKDALAGAARGRVTGTHFVRLQNVVVAVPESATAEPHALVVALRELAAALTTAK